MADIQTITLAQAPIPDTTTAIAGQNFPPGTPCAIQGPGPGEGLVVKAVAVNAACSGLARNAGVAGKHVTMQQGLKLVLTTEQWDAVTDEVGGLVTDAPYYVEAIAGKLTRTAPVLPLLHVIPVGIAQSPTSMLVQISVGRPNPV